VQTAKIWVGANFGCLQRFFHANGSANRRPSFFQAQAVRLSRYNEYFTLLRAAKPQAAGGLYSSILRQGCCRRLPAEPR